MRRSLWSSFGAPVATIVTLRAAVSRLTTHNETPGAYYRPGECFDYRLTGRRFY